MNIVFFDVMPLDYNVDTPLTRPLGGSQSALCYLAVALTQAGHRVSLVNGTTSPGRYSGVQSFALKGDPFKHIQSTDVLECLHRNDVVIFPNAAAGRRLREHFHLTCPLVLWTQHAHNQSAVQDLQDPQEREAWDGFIFGSQWTLDHYVRHFGIRPERSRVLHNGISPVFALAETAPAWFESGAAPILAYTSTPYRGLDVLLDAFPTIRAAIPETRLRVYSGMSVYGQASGDAQYSALYEWCRQTPGVEYIGPVGQAQLASELSGVAALAYPSTFDETFCISAAEAMSAGALLLTTRLGALPELFGEFALMIDFDTDRQRLAKTYSLHVINALTAARRDPAAAAIRRMEQIEFIRTKYFWPSIAMQWAAWLRSLTRKP